MRHDHEAGRLTGRDLAGRAVLLAAGVGAALGAGAGLASAATDGVSLAPTGGSVSQIPAVSGLAGGLGQAPDVSMLGGQSASEAGLPVDPGPVSGDELAALGPGEALSGIWSTGEERATDEADSVGDTSGGEFEYTSSSAVERGA